MTFMFPDEQTPPLNKATIDHVVKTAIDYAKRQLDSSMRAGTSFLIKIRLSRAIGALEAVKPFIGVNPDWDKLRADCDDQWRTAYAADYDEYEGDDFYRW